MSAGMGVMNGIEQWRANGGNSAKAANNGVAKIVKALRMAWRSGMKTGASSED